MEINRRDFVKGTAGIAVATAVAGIACPAVAEEAAESLASQVTETVDFELAIVGSGPSGIVAGVQAAELGIKTIIIEASDIRGGMLMGAEGMAFAGSPLQKEAGIEISIADVVADEVCNSKYHVNGVFWKEMLERSAETYDWLVERGVKFSGVVDDYYGSGVFKTFHWFEGAYACPTALCDPLEAIFNSFEGNEIRLSTKGKELKMADGKVVGVYATTPNGVLEINAKAVILATGGYSYNAQLIEEAYPMLHGKRYVAYNPVGRVLGPKDCDGAGRLMALQAGAKFQVDHVAFMTPRSVMVNTEDAMLQSLGASAGAMWINEEGKRFIREDCGTAYGVAAPLHAMLEQWDSYAIADSAIVGAFVARVADGAALLDEEVAKGEVVFRADTIEELAAQINVNAETLAKSVADYNAAAEAGVDPAFNKNPAQLVALTEAPFYAFYQSYAPYHLLGSTPCNTSYEVINAQNQPIPGLYAAGTEGSMNYFKYGYSYDVPGGACAQCVDSGRVAGRSAAAYIKA